MDLTTAELSSGVDIIVVNSSLSDNNNSWIATSFIQKNLSFTGLLLINLKNAKGKPLT